MPAAPTQHADAPRIPIALALRDIKLAHTVFALPFALLGACLATPALRADPPEGAWPRFAAQLALVVVCMIFARTWAMLVDRVADRRFDARNERTARRAVASGALPARAALVIALASAAAFTLGCAAFYLFFDNPWPVILALPTLAWIALYSYTKRFTALCHLFLGGALAASPLAAAIAVAPDALAHTPAIYALALMVALWVAGFDVLYALQDIDFDRSEGLHSIPARLGARRAAILSRAMHALALGALVATLLLDPRLGAIFALAVLGVAALLVFEHIHVARRGLAGLPVAFGLVNGAISIALSLAGALDLLLR